MPASDEDGVTLDSALRMRARLMVALDLDRAEAGIEVQSLLQHVLQVNRAYLLTHPERVLSDEELARYTELLERRIAGEPVAYLLGMREFYGLELKVTKDTLIPRPDTELLVETALQYLPGAANLLDMGTGSGAIAIAIAHERPDAVVVAVDASAAALNVARENARRLKLGNVRFLESDWFLALQGERFDLIVSNPPYIQRDDVHLDDLRFEPISALASGADGLDDIRRIIANAKDHLMSGGWLMLEHGYDQAERVRSLMLAAGFADATSLCDLSGIERVTIAHA